MNLYTVALVTNSQFPQSTSGPEFQELVSQQSPKYALH